MRQRYLVTYDICDPKRLRAVFKILKGYGEHLQLSVFRCDLAAMALVQLKGELSRAIHAEEDQVLLVDLGPSEGRGELAFEALGKSMQKTKARGATVV